MDYDSTLQLSDSISREHLGSGTGTGSGQIYDSLFARLTQPTLSFYTLFMSRRSFERCEEGDAAAHIEGLCPRDVCLPPTASKVII